jgi:hypothetical protein
MDKTCPVQKGAFATICQGDRGLGGSAGDEITAKFNRVCVACIQECPYIFAVGTKYTAQNVACCGGSIRNTARAGESIVSRV